MRTYSKNTKTLYVYAFRVKKYDEHKIKIPAYCFSEAVTGLIRLMGGELADYEFVGKYSL
jgi:hypothetical protein